MRCALSVGCTKENPRLCRGEEKSFSYAQFRCSEKPPSDEGGGFAKGEDGGRENRSGLLSPSQKSKIFDSPLVRGGHGTALHILSNIYVGAAAVFLGKGQKSPGAGKPRAWDRYGGSFPIRQSRHTAARCGDTLDKNVRLLCFVVTGIGAATFLSEASICHGGGNIPEKIYLSM